MNGVGSADDHGFHAPGSRRARASDESLIAASSSRPTFARAAICAPGASRSPKRSPRKARASWLTGPTTGSDGTP